MRLWFRQVVQVDRVFPVNPAKLIDGKQTALRHAIYELPVGGLHDNRWKVASPENPARANDLLRNTDIAAGRIPTAVETAAGRGNVIKVHVRWEKAEGRGRR